MLPERFYADSLHSSITERDQCRCSLTLLLLHMMMKKPMTAFFFHRASVEGQVTLCVRHLCVHLGGNAGRYYIQVDVILLVQTQVAVTHQVQCVDTPETRTHMD